MIKIIVLNLNSNYFCSKIKEMKREIIEIRGKIYSIEDIAEAINTCKEQDVYVFLDGVIISKYTDINLIVIFKTMKTPKLQEVVAK